jgi:long-chain acyl-CoA synthetase
MNTTLTLHDPPVAHAPVRGATIVDAFRDTARARWIGPALVHHDGAGWQTLTWHDYETAVAEAAVGLRSLGLRPGDRVGILSRNRPEWHIADLAVLAAGLVCTPIYDTSSSSQIAHVLSDSGARVCFVEDGQQLAKVLLRRADLPALERVVVLGSMDGADDGFVLHLDGLRAEGAARLVTDPGAFDALVNAVEPESLATLVYTSGTTGPPKGVMITHANVMASMRSLTSVVELEPTDRFLSFLPLSHITERSVSHFGQIASGASTWFARSLATVPEDLRACRPTLFFAVPRVWEKFHDAILERSHRGKPPVAPAMRRYLSLAARRGDGRAPWGTKGEERTYAVLDRTVGALVRHKLGLDQARIVVSGAAPIHPDLLRWFHGIGLPINEGYGQTEVSLCTSLNPVDDIRIGTVGTPIPGVEVRIADDGEILVRGATVCAGYWGNEVATAELIDPDGWMHSGDLGTVEADGYLRVSGRKKDLIVNAYGKNISPAELETALRNEPLISQAVVIGDDRPYLTALLTLDADAVSDWAAQEGRTRDVGALIEDPALEQAVAEAVARVNQAHAHVEAIRRWRVLPRDLTMAEGELTATLKVRRERVVAEYADVVEELYA